MDDQSKAKFVATFDDYKTILATGLFGGLFILAGNVVEYSTKGKASEFVSFVTSHLITEFGVALIVGALVAGVIERRARLKADDAHDQRRRQIEQDVFRHLFGFGLDASVNRELIETLLASRLMRHDFQIEWQFKSTTKTAPITLEPMVDVLTTVSYWLKNTSREQAQYAVRHYFESVIPLPDEDCHFVECTWEAGGNRVHKNAIDLASILKKNGVRREFALEPMQVAPDDPVRVSFAYRTLRRNSDSEVWISTLPADGITLTVALVDTGVETFEFHVDSSHRVEPIAEPPVTDSRLRRWRLQSGVLPYQGVVLYWSRAASVLTPGKATGF